MTIESIRKHIFAPLKEFQIDFDVYVHTMTLDHPHQNERAKEPPTQLDPDAWKLLAPDYVTVETEADIDQNIGLSRYRTFPCPWKSRNYQTLDNVVRTLYSLQEVTLMVEQQQPEKQYDGVLSFCEARYRIQRTCPRMFLQATCWWHPSTQPQHVARQ